jgi:hypothetical protein
MLKKTVKMYKRGKNGFSYRIDLGKKDNLDGGDEIVILTKDEWDKISKENNESDIKAVDLENNYLEKIGKIEEDYNKIIMKKEGIIEEKENKIINILNDYNDAVDDKNAFKDTIAGLTVAIEKYKNRGWWSRLRNKEVVVGETTILLKK